MAERGELYQAADHHVEQSFADHKGTMKHLRRTADWVEELKPDADEALMIAAVSHDIERSARSPEYRVGSFTDPEFLRYHQETGAQMIAKFLETQNAPAELVDRVKHLVSKHEVGGDDDQNLLKDADTVSFFENNIDLFLTKKIKEEGREAIHEKLRWMFDRITSDKARELAQPFYDEAMKRLDAIRPADK